MPAGGAISITLLRSSALLSWRSVASAPSRICSGVGVLDRRGRPRGCRSPRSRLSAKASTTANLRALVMLVVGAAAGVLHVGLGTQVQVGQFGVLGRSAASSPWAAASASTSSASLATWAASSSSGLGSPCRVCE